MKYIVFVTKHHDGFCNWPTKHTDYCVRKTPLKKDVLGAVANSAQKFGLKLGLYYSLWDRHEKTHDTDEHAYVGFMKNQLHELLTNYGPVVELWFDGFWKKQQTGWKKEDGSKPTADDFILSWRMEGAYRWQMDHLYQYVKALQPDTLVMNNATTAFPGVPLHPVDILSGEKATSVKSFQKEWKWLGKDLYLPMQVETTMSQMGKTQFKSGSWFWHPWDQSVATKEQIMQWRHNAVEMGANLLLNCGPMANGRLRLEDETVLRSLNQ
jgi:alpha-L-fucosidase